MQSQQFIRHYSKTSLNHDSSQSHHNGQPPPCHRDSLGTFNQGSAHFEYYSFKCDDSHAHIRPASHKTSQLSHQPEADQPASLNTFRSSQELMQRYSSLYQQLQEVDAGELVRLFIQEVEENERVRQECTERGRRIAVLQEQVEGLEGALSGKRDVIRKLCETESRNLDLIECLERRVTEKGFDLNDHYYHKYSELQICMNQYICSTRQAQEEMLKRLGQLRSQHSRLITENESLSHSFFQRSKLVGILEVKQLKTDTLLARSRQAERVWGRRVERLQEENGLMKKDIQMLLETVKGYEQFEIDINNKSKGQVSSSLDFIRERLNINLSLSRENVEPAQVRDNGRNFNSKAIEETEVLKTKVRALTEEKEKLILQNSQLMQDYQRLCQRVEKITLQNTRLLSVEQAAKARQVCGYVQGRIGEGRVQDEIQKLLERREQRALALKLTQQQDSSELSGAKPCRSASGQNSVSSSYVKSVMSRQGFSRFQTKNKENQSLNLS